MVHPSPVAWDDPVVQHLGADQRAQAAGRCTASGHSLISAFGHHVGDRDDWSLHVERSLHR